MKLIKCMASILALSMAMSVAAPPVFAVSDATASVCLREEKEPYGVEAYESVLSNGMEYEIVSLTEEERFEMRGGPKVHRFTLQWCYIKTVPFRNGNEPNGTPLGGWFEPSVFSPEDTAVIVVGGLPTSTMTSVDICVYAVDGSWCEWIPAIKGYHMIILHPSENMSTPYSVTVSTTEEWSCSAKFMTGIFEE